jgi:myo-inositol catabolism protein IolC
MPSAPSDTPPLSPELVTRPPLTMPTDQAYKCNVHSSPGQNSQVRTPTQGGTAELSESPTRPGNHLGIGVMTDRQARSEDHLTAPTVAHSRAVGAFLFPEVCPVCGGDEPCSHEFDTITWPS